MNILHDLRYAVRQLTKSPGFTLAAVLTFALGIGATTAIFSLVNSVLIESLPYPQPDQLVRIFEQQPDGGRNSVSGGAFLDWREHETAFESLAISEPLRVNLTGSGVPQTVSGLLVSPEFLSVLGVMPIIGRNFRAEEGAAGGNNQVMVLTHGFWQRRFGSDRNVIGKTLVLDQVPHTIVGVLPPRALLDGDAEFLVPSVINADESWQREGHWRDVIGRVRAGVSIAQAEAELSGIKQRLNALYPSFKKDWSVELVPLREVHAGEFRPTLLILFGTAAFVLLIACTNVSNLMLARGTTRAREMAVRAAMGASTLRMVRQVLMESVLLALLGCAAGLMLALFGIRALTVWVANMLPYALQPEMNSGVMLFAITLAVGCGVLFGMLPAVRASRPDLAHVMKNSERGTVSGDRKRSQAALLVAQFAFTLVLLVGAGLLLRSFIMLLEADPGFMPEHALAFDLAFPDARYPDEESRLRFIDELTDRVAAVPGVESVGVTSFLPLSGDGANEMLSRADRPFSSDYMIGFEAVGGDYLAALGMVLLRGRFINPTDNRQDAPRVLVINSRVAEDLYSDEDPIGQQLRLFDHAWEIIGVVAPVRHAAMHIDLQPRVYAAHARAPWRTSLVVRTATPPLQLVETLRHAVLDVDPDQPITNVRTLEQAVDNALATQRAVLILLSLFAAVSVVLAFVGIYGVMSYAVGQRMRELGIRSALGAHRVDIAWLVISSGLKVSVIGICAGLFAAYLLARFLESLLFEVKAHDPLVFVAATVLLAIIAITSIVIPARRAAGVEPIRVLRDE